jgi:Ca-activated chloride channel family protein
VIFITDGAVGNEDALFALISERLGSSRLFTVGIGSAPNSPLHDARRAVRTRHVHLHRRRERGRREDGAPLREDRGAGAARRLDPLADGTAVETFPAQVPDLYLGEPVLVAAAARAPLATGHRVGPARQPTLERGAHAGCRPQCAGVGALWARAKIAAHMDEIARGAPVDEVRPKVVKVALEHHLVSAYTSMVAVDVTPDRSRGRHPHGAGEGEPALGYEAALPQTDTGRHAAVLLGLARARRRGMAAVVGRRAELSA